MTLDEAITDYLINPCSMNARRMRHALENEISPVTVGKLTAVLEELVRDGAVPGWWGRICLFNLSTGRTLTWRDPQWNEYHGLRWNFRQDIRDVRAMHRRCHGRHTKPAAILVTAKLCLDSEFKNALFSPKIAGNCESCIVRFWEIESFTHSDFARLDLKLRTEKGR